jgi:hypothetical protein
MNLIEWTLSIAVILIGVAVILLDRRTRIRRRNNESK